MKGRTVAECKKGKTVAESMKGKTEAGFIKEKTVLEFSKVLVFLVLAFVFAYMMGNTHDQIVAYVPDAVLYTAPQGGLFSWEESREKAESEKLVTGCAGEAESPIGRITVIDQEYQKLGRYAVSSGELLGFDDDMPQMLLSALQADRLGRSVGDVVEVSGTQYLVKGILDSGNGLLAQITQTEYGEIVVNMPPDEKNFRVNRILFSGRDGRKVYARDGSYELNEVYGGTLEGKFQDLRLMKAALAGLQKLFLFLLMLPVFLGILAGGWKELVKAYAENASSVARRLCSLGLGLFMVAGGCGLWYAFAAQIKIPAQYLPPGHIFDMGYYLREINSFYQSISGVPGVVQGVRMIGAAGVWETVFGVLAVVCFWKFACCNYRFIRVRSSALFLHVQPENKKD